MGATILRKHFSNNEIRGIVQQVLQMSFKEYDVNDVFDIKILSKDEQELLKTNLRFRQDPDIYNNSIIIKLTAFTDDNKETYLMLGDYSGFSYLLTVKSDSLQFIFTTQLLHDMSERFIEMMASHAVWGPLYCMTKFLGYEKALDSLIASYLHEYRITLLKLKI